MTETTSSTSPSWPKTPTPSADLGPLRQSQLYERISGRLVDWIREGRFAGNERLPSERELAARLGVSRSSVREAIGSLQLEGLLETRPGAGSFVAADAADRLRRGEGAPTEDVTGPVDAGPFSVLEARRALEPGIARAAAERGRESERVTELLEQMELALDPSEPEMRVAWNEADRLFHRELAVMSGNPVFLSLADEISGLMDQPLWRRLRDDSIAVPGRTVFHVAEHRLIYQNVIEGDVEAAGLQAEHHIRRVERQMSD
jgi:DNA-binding FadR family transcriptional regulator